MTDDGRLKYFYRFIGNAEDEESYETDHGGLLTQNFFKLLRDTGSDSQNQISIGDLWDRTVKDVQEAAGRENRLQTPDMTFKYDGTRCLPSYLLFESLDLVILYCPEYDGRQKLPGTRKDAELVLSVAARVFSRDCHFVVMMDNPPSFTLGRSQSVDYLAPCQEQFLGSYNSAVESGRNPGVFCFGHGGIYRRRDGEMDNYILQPQQIHDLENRVDGLKLANGVQKFNANLTSHVMVIYADLCGSRGLAGPEDFRPVRDVMAPRAISFPLMALQPKGRARTIEERGLAEDAMKMAAGMVDPARLESMKTVCEKISNLLPWCWNTLETCLQASFGYNVAAFLAPFVGILVLCGVASVFACVLLYLCLLARYPVRMFGPVLLTVLFTTVVPYLCNPNFMQSFVPIKTAFDLGMWTFFSSLFTLMFLVWCNSDRYMQWQNLNRCGRWALGMVGHAQGLMIIALNLHFLGQGHTLQQTMKISKSGVESFVVYFPLRTLSDGSRLCGIPSPADGVVHIMDPSAAHSMLDRDVLGGFKADFTCDYDVFLMRIAERSERKDENLETLSFDEGRHVVNLTYVREITGDVQRLLKIGAAIPKDNVLLGKLQVATGMSTANWTSALVSAQAGELRKKALTERFAPPVHYVIERVAFPVLYLFQRLVQEADRLLRVQIDGA